MDNTGERSNYLFEQYEDALSQQLKPTKSQYVLPELNKKLPPKGEEIKRVDSEYVMRSLQRQHEQNPDVTRDAPHRPSLVGTPVSAKQLRGQIESLDNAIVIPQIVNGKVYFTTHGEADVQTAVEGSDSITNIHQLEQGVDLTKVKFSFAQLVRLLGESTCQRLEREFVKQNKLSEAEINQLKTARESASLLNTAVDQSLLSARTARSDVSTDVLTANSLEPNLLSVHSARSPGLATRIFAKSPGIKTAQEVEPNLLSTHTANSLEPNLLSVYSARSPGLATRIFAKSPGIVTAQEVEPNLLSVKTAKSASNSSLGGKESNDVMTCLELESVRSSQDVLTAREIEGVMSSQDVLTAMSILSDIKSSDDVSTARHIDSISSSKDVQTAFGILESIRSSKDVVTAREIESDTSLLKTAIGSNSTVEI